MQHTLDNTEKALTEHREDYNDQAPEKVMEFEAPRTFDPKFASRTRFKVNTSLLWLVFEEHADEKVDLVLLPVLLAVYVCSSLDKSNLGNVRSLCCITVANLLADLCLGKAARHDTRYRQGPYRRQVRSTQRVLLHIVRSVQYVPFSQAALRTAIELTAFSGTDRLVCQANPHGESHDRLRHSLGHSRHRVRCHHQLPGRFRMPLFCRVGR